MCGISGIVAANNIPKKDVVEKMMLLLNHRGPDGRGLFVDDRCALGHNRLSIVDLEGGAQPMHSDCGRYTLVFNGEIYGFNKIREKLKYPFKTESDTEVILALFKAYGLDFVKHLPGMFALAIWDSKEKELILARDRVGEKPIYYAFINEGLVFASEVTAIMGTGLISSDISTESVAHFLSKLYVHPNFSIYKDIVQLPAGHIARYKNGRFSIAKYWSLPEKNYHITYGEAIEQLSLLVEEAVVEQLVADVPVSVFLSGGLDSSTIAALAKRHKPNIKAITYRFKSGLDEGLYAADVAKLHSLDAHVIWESEMASILPAFTSSMACYGEPFADSSSIPTMQICEATSKLSKVVMSGDGADELFGGYVGRYRPGIYLKELSGSSYFKLVSARIIRGIRHRLASNEDTLYRSLASMHAIKNRNLVESLDYANSVFKDEELAGLGLERQRPIMPDNPDVVEALMELDFLNYLPGDILVKTDRASMAHGLEVRSPFLSQKVIEFAMSLPYHFKIDKEKDKSILREAFSNEWPASVVARGKQGFGSPVASWMARPELKSLRDSVFKRECIAARVKSTIKAPVSPMREWTLFCLAAWEANL